MRFFLKLLIEQGTNRSKFHRNLNLLSKRCMIIYSNALSIPAKNTCANNHFIIKKVVPYTMTKHQNFVMIGFFKESYSLKINELN